MLLQPIAYVRSCYREKFGIPRQPGLVSAARAELHLLPPYAGADTVRGLEQFSHVWIVFRFHATAAAGWHPTVRPPRLGGNKRLGVFATRSMFRPNALGLSVARLLKIDCSGAETVLHLAGADLLDGTPVLDIKPYLPYADCIPAATGGYADAAPAVVLPVAFTGLAARQCDLKALQWQQDIRQLVQQVLAQDPRPSYRAGERDERHYAMKLYDFDVRWRYVADGIEVLELADT